MAVACSTIYIAIYCYLVLVLKVRGTNKLTHHQFSIGISYHFHFKGSLTLSLVLLNATTIVSIFKCTKPTRSNMRKVVRYSVGIYSG